MLLHQDAARHAWLAGRPPLDLVVTLDDATSEVYSAILVEEEGTASSFRALAEVIADHGLFCALYTDRGSHYFHTPVAGGPGRPGAPDPGRPGAGRARHRAHRRLFAAGARPLRARLPHPGGPAAQGAGAGRDHRHRRRQRLAARGLPAGAQRPLRGGRRGAGHAPSSPAAPQQWRDVLCLHETRQVGNDNSVRWQGRRLQIPKPLRPHFARATVRLHEYPDGAVALFWGPHRIADFPPPAAVPMTWRRDPLRRRKRCGQRCRVAHTTTTTEADNPCAT